MASRPEIANISLSHLGIGNEITSIETDRSNEAAAVRRFYQLALETTFRDGKWPFANVIEDLGLIEEDPNEEWAYSYRHPSNCAKIIKILSGFRNDTHQSRVPLKISKDTSGRIILTDKEDAQIEFTQIVDDPQFYTADFILAFSLKLSYMIIPRLSIGDPNGLRSIIERQYLAALSTAEKNAGNEEQPEVLPEAELIRGRE